MKNIRISKDAIFSDFEKYLEEVTSNPNTSLMIPNTFSHSGGFGMEGLAMQVLATWLRCSETHDLKTYVADKDSSDQFLDLCNKFFGLTALRLSDRVLTRSSEEIELSVALKEALPIFKSIRSEDFKGAFKGMYLALPSIKSIGGKNREFDSPLYNGEDVVGAKKFHALTTKALDTVMPGVNVPPDVLDHISEILRELFTNTHRHARTTVNGSKIDKNFRGVIFKVVDMSAARLNEITKSGGANLLQFIGDWLPEGTSNLKLLDITVVDSGPGYARRWERKDKDVLTVEMEKDAIVSCFTKHNSSDGFESAGSGLTNVLSDLKALRGWFKLRTGRTQVEKSFFNAEENVVVENKNIKVMNAFAEGSVLNVVIPVQSLKGN